MDNKWHQKIYEHKKKVIKKFLRIKDSQRKNAIYEEFKQYQNYINILTQNSKTNHYQKFFQDHQKYEKIMRRE